MLSSAILRGYSIGDYSIYIIARINSFVWTLSFFREKNNRFLLLQVRNSFRKISGSSAELANYTSAGIFSD
jgi:predicted 2-oxoglutarate/Fe(II)-dependent dioxygenase YbiX